MSTPLLDSWGGYVGQLQEVQILLSAINLREIKLLVKDLPVDTALKQKLTRHVKQASAAIKKSLNAVEAALEAEVEDEEEEGEL